MLQWYLNSRWLSLGESLQAAVVGNSKQHLKHSTHQLC